MIRDAPIIQVSLQLADTMLLTVIAVQAERYLQVVLICSSGHVDGVSIRSLH